MKRSFWVRSIVGLSLAVLLGCYFYSEDLKKIGVGKDQYLKEQSDDFDHYAGHPKLYISILGAVFVCAVLFGLYEFISWFIFKLMNRAKKENDRLGLHHDTEI